MRGWPADGEAAVGSLFVDVLSGFAAELENALLQSERVDLADQVAHLRITELCECRDTFCTSFYVGPRPRFGAWKDEGDFQNLLVDVTVGMVVLDVVDRVVRYVEVIDRPDIREEFGRWAVAIEARAAEP